MRRFSLALIGLAFAAAAISRAVALTPERHVVLVVFDGMRPDFVKPDTTPNLWALAQRGVFFTNHHAVYLTSTEVNGVAIATGLLPAQNGIVANREYRPALDPRGSFDTESPEVVEKGDILTKGNYLARPTIAAQVQAERLRTVGAGSKGVALLLDRASARPDATVPVSVNVFMARKHPVAGGAGETDVAMAAIPPDALAPVQDALGPMPARITFPNEAQDAWTTDAVLELWKDEVPAFTTIWLSEPDYTQHQFSPGSVQALAAIRSSDGNLGRVIEALKAHGVLEQADIFVVSDHGFSTIERALDIGALLRQAGFDALREFRDPPHPGQIMVVGNSGSISLYVVGRDREVARKLVEHLQTTDYAGAIFARENFDGTFRLAEAGLDTADAPDVLFSLRWGDGVNQYGVPGMIFSDGRRPKGAGTHASLSRFDLNNTLVAAGPDLTEGLQSEIPSGNIDVAPTILHVLGITPAAKMDGRVLHEALRGGSAVDGAPDKKQTERIERARDFEKSRWRQYLQITRYGRSFYIDEGGATNEPK